MVTIDQILYIVPVLALTASILYYAMVIQHQNKTRQIQLFMQVFQELNSDKRWKEFLESIYVTDWEDYDDFQRKYGRENIDFYSKLNSLFWTYNAIGVLLMDKMIDPKRVYYLLGPMVITQWEKWNQIIEGMREDLDEPEAYGGFDYLYGEMIKLRKAGIQAELVEHQIKPVKELLKK